MGYESLIRIPIEDNKREEFETMIHAFNNQSVVGNDIFHQHKAAAFLFLIFLACLIASLCLLRLCLNSLRQRRAFVNSYYVVVEEDTAPVIFAHSEFEGEVGASENINIERAIVYIVPFQMQAGQAELVD